MKKNIVALAVASAIAAPVAMADAPTVYGQINQALEFVDNKDYNGKTDDASSGQEINNIASRLGVKGSSDLGNGLKAVYKVEFALDMDEGDIGDRNQYVGLAGGFGTVLMGRHDTPLKMSQPKDFFNDGTADFSKLTGQMGALGKSGEIRASNVLAYVSPSFGGVKLVAALAPQQTADEPEAGQENEKSSLTDFYSVAAMYGSKKEGLYLAAAMDNASTEYTNERVDGPGVDTAVQHVRLSAQYAAAGFIGNVMYQDFTGDGIEDTSAEGSVWTVGAGYKVGKFMPKVAISMVDRAGKNASVVGDSLEDTNPTKSFEDSTNYAVGVDYALGKKTTAYVDYSFIQHNGSFKDDGDNTVYNAADGSDAEESVWSIGLLHKF